MKAGGKGKRSENNMGNSSWVVDTLKNIVVAFLPYGIMYWEDQLIDVGSYFVGRKVSSSVYEGYLFILTALMAVSLFMYVLRCCYGTEFWMDWFYLFLVIDSIFLSDSHRFRTLKLCPVYALIEFFFLDRKEFCKPVYLALSKKSMLCRSVLDSFSHGKHWMIVVPLFKNQWYIFHATGKITDLKPCIEIVDEDEIKRKCTAFRRLGLTSRAYVKQFVSSAYMNARFVTCQQYANFSGCYLCKPRFYVCFLIRNYGRMSFFLWMVGLAIASIVNYIFGWNLPLVWIFICVYMQDTMDEAYPSRPFGFDEMRSILVAMALCFTFWFLRPFDSLGSLRIPAFLCCTTLVGAFAVLMFVPKFGVSNSEKKKKKNDVTSGVQ